jgi:hypothetical protein
MNLSSKQNRVYWLLAAAWLLVQVGLLLYKGITTDMEGQVYINVANYWLQHGHFEAPKSLFYSVPTLLLAFCIRTGLGYAGFVVIQILVNGLATAALYRLARHWWGSERVGVLAALLFIAFIPLQIWNTYLYTESLFISLTVIYSSWLLRCRMRWGLLPIVALGLLVLTLTRPSGILWVVPSFVYVLNRLVIGRYALARQLGIALLALAATLWFVNFVYRTGKGDLDLMKPYVEEHIICFMPAEKPATGLRLRTSGQPLADLGYYIRHNPGHFAQLFLHRLWAFVNLARPYYSGMHNLLLYLIMVPLYALALRGLLRPPRPCGARLYVCVLLAVYAVAIALQCDDYHSRFIMVLLPYVMVLAAVGLGKKASS